MAKKILIFSLTYHPFVGGAEIAIKEITERLADYHFTLITARLRSDLPKEEIRGNLQIIRVGQGNILDKYLYAFRAARKAFVLHNLQRFSFSWAMMANYAGLAAWLFRLRSRVPYLLTEQSGDSDAFIWRRVWFWLPIYKSMYKRSSHIQAISKFLADRARSFGYRGIISIIPNGVDLKNFSNTYSADERRQLRQKFGLAADDFVVITTSRLVYKNAINHLVRSINIARYKLGVPVRLLILGDGPDRPMLEKLARRKGVSELIKFCGYVDHRQLRDYFACADVFCRPSLTEGLGNSFLESMAFGVPIIATPVGGIVDFLRDGETGLVCEVRNPFSIATAVAKYYQDHDLYEKIKNNGQKLIQQKYSWDTVAGDMRQVFDKLLAETKPKLLIATGTFSPEIGGQAIFTKALFDWWKENASECQIGVITYGTTKDLSVVDVIRVPRTRVRHWRYWREISATFKGKQGVIFAQDLISSGLPAALAKSRKRLLILRLGGDFIWEKMSQLGLFQGSLENFYQTNRQRGWREKIYLWLARYVIRRADLIIFNSRQLRDLYRKYYNVSEAKTKVIHNFLPNIAPSAVQPSERKKVVLFHGRFARYKNLDRLIEAFRRIKNDDLVLKLIGDGPEKERLAQLASGDSRIIISTSLSHENIAGELRQAYAAVFVASTEFNPNSALEAIGYGVPVIMSTASYLANELLNRCLLVDPESTDSIEAGLRQILDPAVHDELVGKVTASLTGYSEHEVLTNYHQTLKALC